jgi:hypothetical protein
MDLNMIDASLSPCASARNIHFIHSQLIRGKRIFFHRGAEGKETNSLWYRTWNMIMVVTVAVKVVYDAFSWMRGEKRTKAYGQQAIQR